jgi:hypothetical protein
MIHAMEDIVQGYVFTACNPGLAFADGGISAFVAL